MGHAIEPPNPVDAYSFSKSFGVHLLPDYGPVCSVKRPVRTRMRGVVGAGGEIPPDHPKVLLAQRRRARDQKIFMRFLSLSGKAQEYYRQMENRRMNPFHHIRQIVALTEIYPQEQVTRAIEDAFHFKAFSCDYIANLLERRTRQVKEPGALHLTRQSDLLDLAISEPDLSIYDMGGER